MSSGAGQCERELFDIVDAGDRVIGQAERGIVHQAGLRHRAAHVLVFDDEGRLLLQRRAFGKDSSPGLWDSSAGGHLDAGESYHDAAVRELGEELGLRPAAPLEPLIKLPPAEATGQEFITVFRCRAAAEPRPDPDEIIDLTWCSREGLERWLRAEPEVFSEAFRLILAQLAPGAWD